MGAFEAGSWATGAWVPGAWVEDAQESAWSNGSWATGAWADGSWGVPSAGGENYSLTLDGSSYGISGTASQLIKATICGLATTSYEQSGTAAGLLRQLKVVGAGGIYEKSGTAAGLLALLKLIGGSGSYETSGTVNLLFRQLVLTAGLTSYAISGTDVSLSAVGDSSLVVDPDSYSITGEDAAFDAFYLSTLGGGSYLLNGVPITFGSNYILYAWPGTISYSGQIALLWYSAEIIGNVLMFLDIKTAEIILAVKSP